MKNSRRSLLLLILGLSLALSCQGLSTIGDGLNSGPAAGLDVDPDSTLFILGSQPRTLDPATTLQGAGGPIGGIFSGLVQLIPSCLYLA